MPEKKPFHLSVLDEVRNADECDMALLGRLLIASLIPEGHNEIIAAIRDNWSGSRLRSFAEEIIKDVLEQKAAAEARAASNAPSWEEKANTLLLIILTLERKIPAVSDSVLVTTANTVHRATTVAEFEAATARLK